MSQALSFSESVTRAMRLVKNEQYHAGNHLLLATQCASLRRQVDLLIGRERVLQQIIVYHF